MLTQHLMRRRRKARLIMAITAQTNTTLSAIADVLRSHDNFCICGHVNPDGDCLGAQLALARVLRFFDKQVTCLLAQNEPIDENLTFLPDADSLMYAQNFQGSCDVFIAVDVPTKQRLGESAAAIHDSAKLTVTIDHHAVPICMADLSYTDADIASTAQLIWQIAKLLEAHLVFGVATCCYTGLMTDTGRFQFQNVDAFVFNLAAEMVDAGAVPSDISQRIYQNRRQASVRVEGAVLSRMRFISNGAVAFSWVTQQDMNTFGAVKSDIEPLVDVLRSIKGVRVACLLREHDDEVRGSFRAKDDTDVAEIANEFGGGGHKAAAGFTVNGTLEHAIEIVSSRLSELFSVDDAIDKDDVSD